MSWHYLPELVEGSSGPCSSGTEMMGGGSRMGREGHTPRLRDKIAEMTPRGGGTLNPEWCEWFMGWPIGWTALQPLETDRFRSWLRAHGRR